MALKVPLFMQKEGADPDITYTAQDTRALANALTRNTEGVSDSGSYKVTQRAAGANFSVDVAAGWAAVQGDDVSNQNMYVCHNTATVNVATPGAPGSGTRVHRVILRIKDDFHSTTWTTYEQTVELLQDTGTGTPATPVSAISLATVSIAAGQASVQNSHITDTRPVLAKHGSLHAIGGIDEGPHGCELIEDITLTSSQATLTFDNIPQIYSHLKIMGNGTTTEASVVRDIMMRFNNDATANNYVNARRRFFMDGTSADLSDVTEDHGVAGGMGSNRRNSFTCEIPNYRTPGGTNIAWHGHSVANSTESLAGYCVQLSGGVWKGTSAITEIDLSIFGTGSWGSGSHVSLYGFR